MNLYENVIIDDNTSKTQQQQQQQQFLENERAVATIENHYDVPKPIKTDNNEEDQQNNIPDVTFQMTMTTTTTPEENDQQQQQQIKSIKDRMLLSTDNTSCLLFTQTITSPMLTPSEENIDFLKGFHQTTETIDNNQQQPQQINDDDVVDNVEIEFAKTFSEPIYENVTDLLLKEEDKNIINDEHIYENIVELKPTTEDDSNKIVKSLTTKFSAIDNSDEEKTVSKEIAELNELKTLDVTKQIISKFEENTTNFATTNSVVVVVSVRIYFLFYCMCVCALNLFYFFFFDFNRIFHLLLLEF